MKKLIMPDFVLTVLNTLQSNGFEAYAAGGCVRDLIMSKVPSDYDIATNAKPEKVIAALQPLHIIETGIKHGTVTVIIDGHSVEVTTFRSDGDYLDNRHPSFVSFDAGVLEDTKRRDFTINAMMYSHKEGIIDHHGGMADIKSRLIRCVGNADERFVEDALRILRALRFASVLGFNVEHKTAQAAFRNRHLLQNISPERKTVEIKKLLCGANVKRVIIDFFDIIKCLFPDLCSDKKHIGEVIDACPNKDYLRLAVLVFYNGSVFPDSIKLDNATKSKIKHLMDNFHKYISAEKSVIKVYMRKLSPPLLFDLLDFQLAEAKVLGKPESDITEAKKIVNQVLENNECYTLGMLAANGNDLQQNNIAFGKKIGTVLEMLLDAVINERVQNEKQALLQYATTLAKN